MNIEAKDFDSRYLPNSRFGDFSEVQKELLELPYTLESLVSQLPYSTVSDGFSEQSLDSYKFTLVDSLHAHAQAIWRTFYRTSDIVECNHSTHVKSSFEVVVKGKPSLSCVIEDIYDTEEIEFLLEDLLSIKVYLEKLLENGGI